MEGGGERWKDISKEKSSNELVDVLLSEMTGQDIAIIQAGAGAGNEYFDGLVSYNCQVFEITALKYIFSWYSHRK